MECTTFVKKECDSDTVCCTSNAIGDYDRDSVNEIYITVRFPVFTAKDIPESHLTPEEAVIQLQLDCPLLHLRHLDQKLVQCKGLLVVQCKLLEFCFSRGERIPSFLYWPFILLTLGQYCGGDHRQVGFFLFCLGDRGCLTMGDPGGWPGGPLGCRRCGRWKKLSGRCLGLMQGDLY